MKEYITSALALVGGGLSWAIGGFDAIEELVSAGDGQEGVENG